MCDGWPAPRTLADSAVSVDSGPSSSSAATAMDEMARVAQGVARAADVRSVVEAVLSQGEVGGLRANLLFEADEERRELTLLGERGVPEDMAERLLRVSFDAPLVPAMVARSRRGLCVQRSEMDGALSMDAEFMDRLQVESLCAIPLIARGRLVGVNAFAPPGSRRSGGENLWALRTIAEVIAVGLNNARGYEHERKLRRSVDLERGTLEAVMRSAPYAIIFAEAGTELLRANVKAQELLGIAPHTRLAELPGWAMCADGTLIAPDQSPLRRVLRGENDFEEELTVVRGDGRKFRLLGRTSRVASAEGGLLGAVTILQDISAKWELERVREQWSSIVAHDMRQPLNAIMLGLSTIERFRHLLPDPARRLLARCRGGAMRLDRLVRDLGDMSQIEARSLALELRSLDLAAVARDVAEELGPTSLRTVSVRVRGLVPKVQADPVRFHQILTNLISNAIKYSAERSEILVDLAQQDGEVQIEISNIGRGIDPEELPHVFDRHYRARRVREQRIPGLGLGLYITKGLVEAHGGTISVRSTPGVRTVFTVRMRVGGQSAA